MPSSSNLDTGVKKPFSRKYKTFEEWDKAHANVHNSYTEKIRKRHEKHPDWTLDELNHGRKTPSEQIKEEKGGKKRGRPKLPEECKKDLQEEREDARKMIQNWHDKNFRYYIHILINPEDSEARKPIYLKTKFQEQPESALKTICGNPVEPLTFGVNDLLDLEKFLYGYWNPYGYWVPSFYQLADYMFIFRADGSTVRGLRALAKELGAGDDFKIPKKTHRVDYS